MVLEKWAFMSKFYNWRWVLVDEELVLVDDFTE